MQGVRDHAFGDRPGAAAGSDDDRDPPGGGGVEVYQVGADSGPGQHPHPGHPVQEGGVDHRVRADDRPFRDRQVVGRRGGDELDVVAEHSGDQGWVDGAQPNDHPTPGLPGVHHPA
jgi:hypothetical protein